MLIMIGTRLKELRERKKLQQDQVAKLLSVNKSAISLYESGMRQPSLDMLIAYARLFKVSTDYLLGVSEMRSLDVAGLTEQQITVIEELISILLQANQYPLQNDKTRR